jgi:hypothetical protein
MPCGVSTYWEGQQAGLERRGELGGMRRGEESLAA